MLKFNRDPAVKGPANLVLRTGVDFIPETFILIVDEIIPDTLKHQMLKRLPAQPDRQIRIARVIQAFYGIDKIQAHVQFKGRGYGIQRPKGEQVL